MYCDRSAVHGASGPQARNQRAPPQRMGEIPSTALVPASDSAVSVLPVPVLVPAPSQQQRIIVETITMTTVTERRIVTDNRINITAPQTQGAATAAEGGNAATPAGIVTSTTTPVTAQEEEEAPALPPKESHARALMNAEPPPDPSSLSGILKGGKLWKSETVSGGGVSGKVACP